MGCAYHDQKLSRETSGGDTYQKRVADIMPQRRKSRKIMRAINRSPPYKLKEYTTDQAMAATG